MPREAERTESWGWARDLNTAPLPSTSTSTGVNAAPHQAGHSHEQTPACISPGCSHTKQHKVGQHGQQGGSVPHTAPAVPALLWGGSRDGNGEMKAQGKAGSAHVRWDLTWKAAGRNWCISKQPKIITHPRNARAARTQSASHAKTGGKNTHINKSGPLFPSSPSPQPVFTSPLINSAAVRSGPRRPPACQAVPAARRQQRCGAGTSGQILAAPATAAGVTVRSRHLWHPWCCQPGSQTHTWESFTRSSF